MAKNLILWIIIAVVLMAVFTNFSEQHPPHRMSYSQFIDEVDADQVRRVVVDGYTIIGERVNGERFETIRPAMQDSRLVDQLLEHNVIIEGRQPEKQSLWAQLLVACFPILLIVAIFMFFMRQMQGGAGGRGGPMTFGKSRARLLGEDQIKTTFSDVAGVEEAKEDVQEIVEFLKDPGKFQKLGGKIPRGVLMVGPPGTGKTLLAKAIAGEAKVPFFTISGSDFVEMFVGVGASRVRDMFEQAKKQAPCIIFIDEIDAVGRSRGAGLGGGHDEREQTLNQLLVEMDGFEANDGVIVIAATNRPDVLDSALLRPGRFDRQVVVSPPDIRGREQILKVHMRKVPVADNVNPALIARGTPGFSGADLANLVNEAALFAARANKRTVEMREFELAKDKILMGTERKSMVMSEKEKRNTAYHEAGHAIVGRLVPEHDPVYKVSIIPRGRALGVTQFLPEEDRYSLSKRSLESRICSLYGGRIAEEMTLGADGVTTGASNDIQRATEMARNMVTKWGLSEKMGPQTYEEEEGEVFLGRSVAQRKNISGQTAKEIDEEVRAIIDRCYARAEQLLEEHRDKLEIMAEALMQYETLEACQIDEIMEGKKPSPPKYWMTLAIIPLASLITLLQLLNLILFLVRLENRSVVIDTNIHERADVTTQVLKVSGHLKLSGCYFHTNSLPRVMGVLNVTPDSFSDGGRYLNLEAAISRAREMIHQGASLVDVGGESTRPGALPVSVDEELARVIPVIEALSASTDILISVDTSKPEVMSVAAQAGAHLINDVKALRVPGALEAVAKTDLSVCLMHMQGESLDMQHNPVYDRVVNEVMEFLRQRLNACVQHGIAMERCLIDPGFGFGKTLEHNIALLRRLSVFQSLKVPLLIGVSRKSMIGKMLGAPLEDRLYGGLGLAAWAVVQGAKIIRTHDVKETVDVLKVLNEVMACPNES